MKLYIFCQLRLITGLRNNFQDQPNNNSSGYEFRGYKGS